jgi:hypothetical protein
VKFRATLEQHGKTATGITVPDEVVEALGSGRRPAVTVTINKHSYSSTVAVMKGVNLIPVSAEQRAAAGVAAGDVLEVELTLDTAPRTVEVPSDLAAALRKASGATTAFEALSYSNQRQHVLSVTGAKTPETRERRIAKVVEALTS